MSPDLVLLIVEAGSELVKALVSAFSGGGTAALQSALAKPVDQILPTPLLTTLAKKAADAEAAKKFGQSA